MEKYDVIIIGAGVTGTGSCKRTVPLSDKNLCTGKRGRCMLWNFQSKQCDHPCRLRCRTGNLKAKLNVRGNLLIGELAEKLDFPFKRNGSLVLCLDEKDYPNLQKLYEKGITNGVKKLRILNHDEVLEMEPNVSENVYAALYAPTGGIVCPFNMTIAFAENACVNGVEFRF